MYLHKARYEQQEFSLSKCVYDCGKNAKSGNKYENKKKKKKNNNNNHPLYHPYLSQGQVEEAGTLILPRGA